MPSCVIPTCRRASGDKVKKPVTFHKFPRDEIRKEIWIKIIQSTRLDKSWKPTPASIICSEHFHKEDIYNTQKGFKRLRPEAIPSKNIVCGLGYPTLTPEAPSNDLLSKNVTDASPTSSKRDSDEVDAVTNFSDDSKIMQLKSDLRRLKEYCKKYINKIRLLQRRTLRLTKQNQLYKRSLHSLENNQFVDDDIYNWISEKVVTIKDLNSIKIKFTRKTLADDNFTQESPE